MLCIYNVIVVIINCICLIEKSSFDMIGRNQLKNSVKTAVFNNYFLLQGVENSIGPPKNWRISRDFPLCSEAVRGRRLQGLLQGLCAKHYRHLALRRHRSDSLWSKDACLPFNTFLSRYAFFKLGPNASFVYLILPIGGTKVVVTHKLRKKCPWESNLGLHDERVIRWSAGVITPNLYFIKEF